MTTRAGAKPGSLHSFVSLIFTHFEKSKRNPDEKTRGIARKIEFLRKNCDPERESRGILERD
jgi:hypothetical protein